MQKRSGKTILLEFLSSLGLLLMQDHLRNSSVELQGVAAREKWTLVIFY